MKWNRSLLACAFIAGLLTVTMFGCITRNPNAGQPVINPSTGQPVIDSSGHTNVQPTYLADADTVKKLEDKVNSVLDKAAAVNTATAAINPYSGPVATGIDLSKTAVAAIGTIGTSLSLLLAWFKNKTAKVQTAAAETLAKHDTNALAIANAPTPEVAAAIAVHDANQQSVQPIPTT